MLLSQNERLKEAEKEEDVYHLIIAMAMIR